MAKSSTINFTHALAAVLAGNAAYFLLTPYLPAPARHVLFRQDFGLVVDFAFCLAAFGILRLLTRSRSGAKPRDPGQ
jgi:hypothetical protein